MNWGAGSGEQKAGLTAGQLDTATLTDPVVGYGLSQSQTARSAIEVTTREILKALYASGLRQPPKQRRGRPEQVPIDRFIISFVMFSTFGIVENVKTPPDVSISKSEIFIFQEGIELVSPAKLNL